MRKTIDKLTQEDLKEVIGEVKFLYTHTGDETYKTINCALVPAGFDIECYKQYMYIWTFTIYDFTVIGYTWEDFHKLLSMLKEVMSLGREVQHINHRDGTTEDKNKAIKALPIFIHNIKYEWAFMKSQINVSGEVFYMDAHNRNPMYVICDESFLFLDSYKIYPMRLEEVAKCYCKTRKTHDLDYNKPRNVEDAKHLSEKELTYCCNDTIILSELAQYTFDTYFIPTGKLPMTQNQIIKSIIKGTYKNEYSLLSDEEKAKMEENLKNWTLSSFEYYFIREKGFRGGYCASSLGDKEHVGYGDLTSAYFASIMHDYYPMSGYTPIKNNDGLPWPNAEAKIDYYCEDFCVSMCLRFKNIRVKGEKLVKYESIHNVTTFMPDGSDPITDDDKKILKDSIGLWGANRIYKAGCFVTNINELDWDIYKRVYDWDSVEILEMLVADKGPLPYYIKKTAIDLYQKKAALKKSGNTKSPEYFSAKTLVSNVFGCIVQQQDTDCTEKEWLRDQYSNILKPQWGCYVTAHVRKNLIDMILALGKKFWLYSDTDSIYYVLNKDTKKIFDLYNAKIKLKNLFMCKKYGLDYRLFDDLGCWDDESRKGLEIIRFKTIGPKAYLYYYKDKDHKHGDWKLVLAGIPEQFFWEAYAEKYPVCDLEDKEGEINRIFAFFTIYTEITYKRNKLVPVNDTTDIINGMEVHCNTGVYIDTTTIVGTIGDVQTVLAIEALAEEADDHRNKTNG